MTGWCESISSELRASTPLRDEYSTFRSQVEKQIGERVGDPEAHFSFDEIERTRDAFDQMIVNVEEMGADDKILEDELDEIRKAIETITENIAYYPKGVWYSTTANRLVSMLKMIKSNRSSRKELFQITKELLGISDDENS